MKTRWVEVALWSVGIIGTMRGVVAVRALHADTLAAVEPMSALPAVTIRPTEDSLAEAVAVMAEDNLFRADRSAVDTTPQVTAPVVGSAPPKPPKPALVLRGILGGPPWDAVIDGVPGHDAAIVMRAGQSASGLLVRSVSKDSVVVRGMDTTWRLTLRRP